jgi:hypothetical protein
MQNNTIVREVEIYRDQFIRSLIERIQTKEELHRVLHAIRSQIAATEDHELRDMLRKIEQQVFREMQQRIGKD